jgi:cell division protease FtsH
MSKEEKDIIAYHEAGHAVVMHSTPMCDPVFKITIIPRGRAGGYTMALPEQDQNLVSRCKLIARITGLLGGRAAEEIFFHDITSGASNDLNVATQLAEEMVMRLGMHPSTGLRVFPQSAYPSLFGLPQSSQKTHETIDGAVNDILESCYNDAKQMILEKRDKLELLANELLEKETLDREQFVVLMG